MRAEQWGVSLAALEDLSLGARFTEHFTQQQYNTVYRNLGNEGILARLGKLGDPAAPFDAYMGVMDGITFPYPLAGTVYDIENPPKRANLIVPFTGSEQRTQFYDLTELAWAGLHGPDMLKVRLLGERGLTLTNFSYPDLCTLGRIGRDLLIEQYGEALGRNARLVQDHIIKDIEASGVVKHLPQELRERITFLKDELGELALELLLSSGRVGLLGIALRLVLGHDNLDVQHPKGHQPWSEKDTAFYLTAVRGKGIPISGSTMRRELSNQGREYIGEITGPFREKDRTKILLVIWELLTELRATEGAFAVVKALGTIGLATHAARRSKRLDDWTRTLMIMERHMDTLFTPS